MQNNESEPLSSREKKTLVDLVKNAGVFERVRVEDGKVHLMRERYGSKGDTHYVNQDAVDETRNEKPSSLKWASGVFISTEGMDKDLQAELLKAFGDKALPADCSRQAQGSIEMEDAYTRVAGTVEKGIFVTSDIKADIKADPCQGKSSSSLGSKIGVIGTAALFAGVGTYFVSGVGGATALANIPWVGSTLASNLSLVYATGLWVGAVGFVTSSNMNQAASACVSERVSLNAVDKAALCLTLSESLGGLAPKELSQINVAEKLAARAHEAPARDLSVSASRKASTV